MYFLVIFRNCSNSSLLPAMDMSIHRQHEANKVPTYEIISNSPTPKV